MTTNLCTWAGRLCRWAAAGLLLGLGAFAQAGVLNRVGEGHFRNSGQSIADYPNTFVGREIVTGPWAYQEVRSYFVFDLTGVTSPVTSAFLQLELNAYFGSVPSQSFTVRDVDGAAGLGAGYAPGSSAGLAYFDDLGSGTVYGTGTALPSQAAWRCLGGVTCSGSINDPGELLTVALNAAALADINDHLGERIAFGLSLDDTSADGAVVGVSSLKGIRFRASFGESRVPIANLVFETAPVSAPGSLALVAVASAGLLLLSRRCRGQRRRA